MSDEIRAAQAAQAQSEADEAELHPALATLLALARLGQPQITLTVTKLVSGEQSKGRPAGTITFGPPVSAEGTIYLLDREDRPAKS